MRFERKCEDAYSKLNEKILTVGNSFFQRSWEITDDGPLGIGYVNKLSNTEYNYRSSLREFQFPDGCETEGGKIRGASSETVEEDSFTSKALRVGIRWYFPAKGISIRWDIKIYPESPGMWMCLYAEGNIKGGCLNPSGARCAFMPKMSNVLSAFGYYNDTQNRNKDQTEILREEPVLPGEHVDWANALLQHEKDGGWMLVKESHKCANQQGYDTGMFLQTDDGVAATGWGLRPGDILDWKLRGGWANWFVVWGGDYTCEKALKCFDKKRYPFDGGRDVYIMANTWGSGRAREAAYENSVCQEIDIASELGVDAIQIDDGWQTEPGRQSSDPSVRWMPVRNERFTNGWEPVQDYAKKRNVSLGLWASWAIPVEELIENMRHAGFKYFKIDFANLDSYEKIEGLTEKARSLINASGATVRINWDATENQPRFGHYYGREFGNIYLANRKPENPRKVIYIPRLVLRDAWQISKYLPLSKFQIVYQNIDMVDENFSNAKEYTHDYCLAITLMSSPIFFQELKYLSGEAKKSITPLIKAYKKARGEILSGLVSPIGDKPCDKAISGFQCSASDSHGYILLFRELYNEQSSAYIRLNDVENENVIFENLLTGDRWKADKNPEGEVSFSLPDAPGYLFLKYVLEMK